MVNYKLPYGRIYLKVVWDDLSIEILNSQDVFRSGNTVTIITPQRFTLPAHFKDFLKGGMKATFKIKDQERRLRVIRRLIQNFVWRQHFKHLK